MTMLLWIRNVYDRWVMKCQKIGVEGIYRKERLKKTLVKVMKADHTKLKHTKETTIECKM